MKELAVLPKHESKGMRTDKGKNVQVIEPAVQHPNVTVGADEPESSKQVELRGGGGEW
jgi:hypothetical protein